MKTGPRLKDVVSKDALTPCTLLGMTLRLRPCLLLYIYLSACYTYLWLLNDDVVECPTLTGGMQRTKMIIIILHPTQQILNRLACSGHIKAKNCGLESFVVTDGRADEQKRAHSSCEFQLHHATSRQKSHQN